MDKNRSILGVRSGLNQQHLRNMQKIILHLSEEIFSEGISSDL
jgi:hypothetical protein